ncbi:MAG: T9SS type A sorting domain-containing protein [Saprospiraceae bacterium]|nr:T9SS type A sorting domain-containing protein [Saprospiraceae bacterium]
MKSCRILLLTIVIFLGSTSIFPQARFQLLDRWAYGVQNQIYFINDVGYVNSGATMVIADFSDTLNPVKIDEIEVDKVIDAFIVAGDHLYIGDRYQLWTLALDNPAHPTFIDKIDLVEPVQKWYYHEDRLYQIGNKSIYIYSLDNPKRPELISSIQTDETMWNLVFKDSLIFASARYYSTNYILTIDLADLENPLIRENVLSGSTYINALGSYEDYLVAGGGGKVYFLNVQDPSHFLVEHAFDVGFVYEFFSNQGILFITRQGYGVDCFEMTNLHDPQYAGTIDCRADKIVFHGKYAFVASDHYGDISVYDISDLIAPFPLGHVIYGGFNYDMEISSGYAFISQDDRVAVLDITTPSNLVEVSSIPTTESKDLEIKGDLLFISEGDLGWSIVDVSNINAPQVLVNMPIDGYVNELLIRADYLYVAAGTGGVQIFDVTNPSYPVEIGRYSNGNYFEKIYAVDPYIYAYEDSRGIKVLDVVDKSNPIVIDSVSIMGGVRSMLANENRLYVGINGDSRMLDISDPAHPSDLGSVYFWQNPLDLFISDDILYVAELSRGLNLYDASDPSGFIDRYDEPAAASRIIVENDVIYLLDQLSGLSVLQYGVSTGIQQPASEYGFTIQPNPASDWIQLNFNPARNRDKLVVKDLTGKILMKQNLLDGSETVSFSISNFTPGVYILSIENQANIVSQKFIKH